MKPIFAGCKKFIRELNQLGRIDTETLSKIRRRGPRFRILRHDQLKVAEGDRMHEDANAAVGTDRLNNRVERFGAGLGVNRVGIPCVKAEAVSFSDRSYFIKMRLDIFHGAAAIAMDHQDIEATSGQTLCGCETEAARSTEDQRPFVARKACA